MASLIEKLWRDPRAHDRHARLLRQRVFAMCLVSIPIYSLFALVNAFAYQAHYMSITSGLSALTATIALLLLLSSKYDSLPGHVFTLALAIQVFGEMAVNGGMLAPATSLSLLIVPAAIFTAGARAIWPWAVATVVLMAILFTLDIRGLIPSNELPPAALAFDRLFSVLVGIAISAMLIILYQRQVDTTMQKLTQERADFQHYALHDALTGLPNRRLFSERGEEFLYKAGMNSSARVLLYMDINRFKQINDTHGHAAGDAVLKEFANRLQRRAGPDMLVARLSGDEFAMISKTAIETPWLTKRLEDLRSITDDPIAFEELMLETGMSIGQASFPVDGTDLETLLSVADSRMYEDKLRLTDELNNSQQKKAAGG